MSASPVNRNVAMSMLGTTVALHDIQDAEGFVGKTILRSGLRASRDDFDELKAEGLLILCAYAERFEPHRPGYAQPGRFSGYAARYLPGKLSDAWRKLHPELRHTDAEGEHPATPLSLDMGHDDGTQKQGVWVLDPVATAYIPGQDTGRFDTLNRALAALPTVAREPAAQFMTLTGDGHGIDTIASTMGLRRGDIQRLRTSVREAITTVKAQTEAA